MENIFTGRRRNMTILVGVLTVQFFGLAAQYTRTTEQGTSAPLLRIWAINAITPFQKLLFHASGAVRGVFNGYIDLRNVRKENETLRDQIEQLRIQQVRLQQDAAQAHRLQALLSFKEQFISETVPAQVIGTSGTDLSRTILIDKGLADGLKDNMAVITPDGIVGKIAKATRYSSQVLLISDPSWGAGAILTQSRLQGIVKGTQAGTVQLQYIMADNPIKPGEPIITSGGDRIFPKGLPIGTVRQVDGANKEGFLNIRIQPAADLSRLEEVLVITKIVEKQNDEDITGPIRAADILAQRLPSVPQKPLEGAAPEGKKPEVTPESAVPPRKVAEAGGTTALKPKPTESGVGTAPKPQPMESKPATTTKPGATPAGGQGANAKPAEGTVATTPKGSAKPDTLQPATAKPATAKPATPKPATSKPATPNQTIPNPTTTVPQAQ